MVRLNRIALALLAAASTAGQASAQPVDEGLTTMVATWVDQEATNFYGVTRQYIAHCVTNTIVELPDEAQQTFVDAGDVDIARQQLAGNAPEMLAEFQEGVSGCARTASQFASYVLDWVFATQLPDAEGDVLLAASFCVIDAFLPLDEAARETLYLGIDQRRADLREHGIALLAVERPDVAADMTAAVDACLTQ